MRSFLLLLAPLWMLLVVGCQVSSVPASVGGHGAEPQVVVDRNNIDAPLAWGGEVRCGSRGCYLGVVEHETSKLALHRLSGRASSFVDRQPLAYHPDSAKWLTDDLLVAAVEDSDSLDVFRIEQEKLVRVQQIGIAFHPRDVIVLGTKGGEHQMLATPYSGKRVAWVQWQENIAATAKVQWADWCASPWHPVKVSRTPKLDGAAIAVACLDDRKVVVVPENKLTADPLTLANFPYVPRMARPSPSGKWLYIAIEIGGKNARIDMDSGEIQFIDAHEAGSVSVVTVNDEFVIWGGDRLLQLQRVAVDGTIKEQRWLPTSGFSTGLQLVDADGDGEQDLIVFNSDEGGVDVIYGPLWDRASKVISTLKKN